jgi:hypothetical protein
MFPKHCFFTAGSSIPLLDNLYTFDLGGYLGWFRPSDSIFVHRNLSMALNSSNQAKIGLIRHHNIEDTGLYIPSFRGSINVSSKDDHGTLSVDSQNKTSAYIKLVNLDPEIHVTTKSISMRETYLTTVRSSADIPKFLLWLQGKVRYLSSRTMVDGRLCILNVLITSEYLKPHQRPIPSPFDRHRYLDR